MDATSGAGRDPGRDVARDAGRDVARDADGRGDEAAADIVVVTKGVTEIEAAALMAVLSEVITEATSNTAEVIPGPSVWERSQHIMRTPIVPGRDAWRGFAG